MSMVFISYAHSSDQHKQAAFHFATQLKEAGFNVKFDQFEEKQGGPNGGWEFWQKTYIDQARYVALFLDKKYRTIFDYNHQSNQNYSVSVEIAKIKELFRSNQKTNKIIPVLSEYADEQDIPAEYQHLHHYRYPQDFAKLIDNLHNHCAIACRHCHKTLGWKTEYCPFCGQSQTAVLVEASNVIQPPAQTIQTNDADNPLEKGKTTQSPDILFTKTIDTTITTNVHTPNIITSNGQEDRLKQDNLRDNPLPKTPPSTSGTPSTIVLTIFVVVVLLAMFWEPMTRKLSVTKQPNDAVDSTEKPEYHTSQSPQTTPIEPDMVAIKPGCFYMGSPENEPGRNTDERLHRVCLDKAFYLGKYEVTFEEYDRFAEAKHFARPADDGYGRGKRPVFRVTWEEANQYAAWLSYETGKHYRLPTEAEWEYAARASDNTPNTVYFWGNDWKRHCEYIHYMDCANAELRAIKVGQHKPNALGLYDILGNVTEMTASAYDEDYQDNKERLPIAIDDRNVGNIRIARGGSWLHSESGLRLADRTKTETNFRHNVMGFRLARN